ncbi:aryl-sulfate sulfotransferase [Nocardioides sp. TF02-7]|nr:aryl-sulfate sulfotransferase [Nocardioides sp. TF02-7]
MPVHLHDHGTPVTDLKPAPGGHYTVMRRLPGPESDWDLVELDEQLREVRTYRTVGLRNTDNHDSILRADGSRLLLAYEPDDDTGLVDAAIQEVDADGDVVHTWDSGDHLDVAAETTASDAADYAHVNSIEVLPDGDVLASFRHLSAVLKIAWSDHDGHQRGDVVWRLGGRLSDFEFLDDPHGGPCAQHTATRLANGNLLVFDNGSVALGANPSYCVDPDDRGGPTVDRPVTRVAEYELDEAAGTARLVWSYADPTRFSYFAGSSRRLAGGTTLVGWASDHTAIATEVAPDGTTVWELRDLDPDVQGRAWSYRVEKAVVPDAIAPELDARLPGRARFDVGDVVRPRVTCTDRGGSSLRTCATPALRTSQPGRHTVRVTATDGAGNATRRTLPYRVTSPRPALAVRDTKAWRDRTVLRVPRQGKARTTVRVVNRSVRARRIDLRGPEGGAAFDLRYQFRGNDVTRAVVAGTWRTPRVAPGAATRLIVTVVRRAPRPAARTFGVAAAVRAGDADLVRRVRLAVRPGR